MKTRTLLVLSSICLFGCNDHDSSICNPADCEMPPHASQMACDLNNTCFVKSCDDGFDITSNALACAANTMESCNADDCPLANNAKEMTCSNKGCAIKSCLDGFKLSDEGNNCISNIDYNCTPDQCDKPDHAKEMACSQNGCIVKACDNGFAPNDSHNACEKSNANSNHNADGCSPNQCKKPDHAKDMACTQNGCIVLTCNAPFVPSPDYQSCIQAFDQCNPAECDKPDHAKEMACTQTGCIIKSCDDGFIPVTDHQTCRAIRDSDPINADCNPDQCTKPEHAKDMICTQKACIVLSCDDGYVPIKSHKACVPTSELCIPDNCPKPDYAASVTCSDNNECIVSECSDGHDVSEDKKSCVCPTKHAPCKKPGERRCCGDSEYECGANWIWFTNVCSQKLNGGWCDKYTYYDKSRVDITYACFTDITKDVDRGEMKCNQDNLKQRAVGTSCVHPPESPTVQFYSSTCQLLDNDKFAFVGSIGAISLCKDKNTKYECDQTNYKVITSPCNSCREDFTGMNYIAVCD